LDGPGSLRIYRRVLKWGCEPATPNNMLPR
jgi:hypothetical protein